MSIKLKVTRVTDATSRIKVYELADPEGGELPPFTAGAHLDLELGIGEERSYSLMNDPREPHRYEIAVQRESDSRGGSVWMHDAVKVGDIITSSEPLNNFSLNEAGERHVLIAGGIGITPIIGMARRLAATGGSFDFHYCARDRDVAAFADALEQEFAGRIQLYLDGG